MVKIFKWPFFVCLAGCLLCLSFIPANNSGVNGIKTIVIDAGHGGRDPGCHGESHLEKEIALAVALKLGKFIEENLKDVKVVYTRTTDVFVDLEERAQIANRAKADLFVSIHCNAAGKAVMVKDARTGKMRPKKVKNSKGRWINVETSNPEPFGTETYVMGLKNEAGKMEVATRENSVIFLEEDYEKKYGGFDPESEESYIIMSNYTSAYVIQSANLAMKLQEEYVRKAGRYDRGVHRQSIWVLWRTSMPSVLTELGFLTNPAEEKFLGSEIGQDYVAKAIFRGIRKYKDETEGLKREYNDEFEKQVPLLNENLHPESAAHKKPELAKQTETAESTVTDGSPVEVTESTEEVVETEAEDAEGSREIAEKYKQKNTPSIQELCFKVQFASSDVALNLKQGKFSAVTDADFYRHNDVLKYTSGKFSTLKDAHEHQKHLRGKGFSDCFVIAMRNGKRIDIGEAKKILEGS